jgi:hypothetical protein
VLDPEIATEVIESEAVPVLVIVTVLADEPPVVTVPNASAVAESVTAGAGTTPVPVRATV